MNYPTISDYIVALKSTDSIFETLTYLNPIMDENGSPINSYGKYAVVFKMQDKNTGKFYALKCFTKYIYERNNAYKKIESELNAIDSEYLIKIQYLENEINIKTKSHRSRYPIVLMEWVEGKTLDIFIKENLNDKYQLEIITYKFCLFAKWILSQPFAHGNLVPQNIIITEDGKLRLIDYDSIYLKSMQGQNEREAINLNFRNPNKKDFDEHIDDFPIITILLSLKLISVNPLLADNIDLSERLLFTEKDYKEINKCYWYTRILVEYLDNKEIATLNSLFLYTYHHNLIDYNMISVEKPITTSVTKEEKDNIIIEDGGIFTKDKIKFLGIHKGQCQIPNSLLTGAVEIENDKTKIICDNALEGFSELSKVDFKSPLKAIGYGAFKNIRVIKSIILPATLDFIFGNPFEGSHIVAITNLSKNFLTTENAIYTLGYHKLIAYFGNKDVFKINEKTKIIGKSAFANNKYLTKIEIPQNIEIISDNAFFNCKNLKEIKLLNGIKEIGDEAFFNTQIKEICLPSSLIKLGRKFIDNIENVICQGSNFYTKEQALYTANGKTIILYWGNKDSYIVPKGVEMIYESAFIGNNNLKTIIFPESLKTVGKEAFAYCTELKTVEFNSQNTTIGQCCFEECNNLQLVKLPTNIKKIEYGTFEKCESLISCELPDSVESIGERAFYDCNKYEVKILPNNVKYISKYAFSYCESIKKLDLPEKLEVIGEEAFCYCTSLKEITLSPKLKVIEYRTFDNCKELEVVTIPEGVEMISSYAFAYCESIKTLLLPLSLNRIQKEAFLSTDSLRKCVLQNPNTIIEDKAFNFYDKEKFKLFLPKGADLRNYTHVMPERIVGYSYFNDSCDLPNYAPQSENIVPYLDETPIEEILEQPRYNTYPQIMFKDKNGGSYTNGKLSFVFIDNKDSRISRKDNYEFVKYEILDGTKYISNNAFLTYEYGWYRQIFYHLQEIIIPDSVIAIGDNAFEGLNNLTFDKLPQYLEYIGDYSFSSCIIKEITIPSKVKKIGQNPFRNTPIENIKNESQFFKIESNCLLQKDGKRLICCFQRCKPKRIVQENNNPYNLFEEIKYEYEDNPISIQKGIECIDSYAFAGIEISSITIPDTVLEIKNYAFANCRQLKFVKLPNKLSVISEGMFLNCISIDHLIIPDNVYLISNDAFRGCNIATELIIPANIEVMGINPFRESKINSIISKSSIFKIIDHILYDTKRKKLISFLGGKAKVEVIEDIVEISEAAFYKNQDIEEIILPKSIKHISRYAFQDCHNLRKVITQKSNLQFIDSMAFWGCEELQEIDLSSAKYIGSSSFWNCQSLKNISLSFNCTEINDNAFTSCTSLESIFVPTGFNLNIIPQEFKKYVKEITDSQNISLDTFGAIYDCEKNILLKGIINTHQYNVKDGTIEIGEKALQNCKITKILIPNSVKKISYNALKCKNLDEIILPENLETIGYDLFDYYSEIGEITIPHSVREINGNPFITAMPIILFNKSKYFRVINNCLYSSDLSKLISYNRKEEKKYIVPDVVKYLDVLSFAKCKLENIILQDSICEIGEYAFCSSSIKSIDLSNAILSIKRRTFDSCTNLKEIIWGKSIEEIEDEAFYNCYSLEEIIFPESIKCIGKYSFKSCSNLKKITITNPNILIHKTAFDDCWKLSRVYVPKGYKSYFENISRNGKVIEI